MLDDLVEAISNNSNNKIVNEDNNKIVTEDNNKIANEDNNVNEDNNKTVNEDNDNDYDYDSDDYYDSDGDHDEQYYEIRQRNRSFKKTDETKSFEDQIDIVKNYHACMITGL